MTTKARPARDILNDVLNWVSLAYGLYATALGPVFDDDDVQIAVGGELVLLALVGFLWAGRRGPLGWALIITGLCAPIAMYSTASLFWDETDLFTSEAFWTSAAIGAVIGLPLLLLGVHVLRRARPVVRDDPWWLFALRWLIFAGMWIVVFAFRTGDWADGVTLVYAGAALALAGVLVALPRRLSVTRRGLGLFLAFLGLAVLAVIAVAGVAVGSHMSGDEAMTGIVPAVLVATLGGVLALVRPAAQREPAPEPELAAAAGVRLEHDEAPVEDVALDILQDP